MKNNLDEIILSVAAEHEVPVYIVMDLAVKIQVAIVSEVLVDAGIMDAEKFIDNTTGALGSLIADLAKDGTGDLPNRIRTLGLGQ